MGIEEKNEDENSLHFKLVLFHFILIQVNSYDRHCRGRALRQNMQTIINVEERTRNKAQEVMITATKQIARE